MHAANGLAPTPPLGWNSWDCYGPTVREDEVKANADYMAAHLAQHGWQYIVVDIQWYEPQARAGGYRQNAELIMDNYGRLLPALNRFPSAANGGGFKALADTIHDKGLKFGIHIMRGIPRQAVRQALPVMNTAIHAPDIADTRNVCAWNDDMYGIDIAKPGAQEYYNSILELYASWGVDYIKADDMIAPVYHRAEIEALAQAIKRTNREIVLSLSPGTDLSTVRYVHLSQYAQLWRISNDLWDRWEDVKAQFENCEKWARFARAGCWPDADMLPLGRIGIRAERGVDRQSQLTHDEQFTLMTLWIMSRSPLMFGGDLPSLDAFTLGLLTNDEVLRIHRASSNNHELFRRDNQIGWIADDPASNDRFLALFNLGADSQSVEVNFPLLGNSAGYEVRDVWAGKDLGKFRDKFGQRIGSHGAGLYWLRPITS